MHELTEFINGGSWNQSEYVPNGVPVIKVTNLKNGGIDTSELSYISESSLTKYGKHSLKEGDLVVTTVGSHPNVIASAAGRVAIITKKVEGYLLNQNAVCIRSVSELLNQKYLGYIGKSTDFQAYIKSIARGAANQVRIAISLIKEFELVLPRIDIQKRIASILSAYDDLIENNLRRIQLLEEAARCRYKMMMEVSEEWEKANLYDIVNVQMGFPFDSKYFNETGLGEPIIRIRDIPNQITKSFSTELAATEYRIKQGDLLIGMDGEFHMNEWGGQEGYLVQRVCRIRAKNPLYQSYVWQALKEPILYYQNTISGATVSHLGAKHLREITLKIPPQTCEIELASLNEYRNLKVCLFNQNKLLRQAHDILLPKLMSGEIEV